MITASPARVIAAARGWIGTPYHHQASARGLGCDCLGLARGVWREVVGREPVPVPAYSRDWGEVGAREVLIEALRAVMREAESASHAPGMLLVFRMVPRAMAKHAGIMVAPDRFVHAHERLGVVEEGLTRAWARRVVCAFEFPQGVR